MWRPGFSSCCPRSGTFVRQRRSARRSPARSGLCRDGDQSVVAGSNNPRRQVGGGPSRCSDSSSSDSASARTQPPSRRRELRSISAQLTWPDHSDPLAGHHRQPDRRGWFGRRRGLADGQRSVRCRCEQHDSRRRPGPLGGLVLPELRPLDAATRTPRPDRPLPRPHSAEPRRIGRRPRHLGAVQSGRRLRQHWHRHLQSARSAASFPRRHRRRSPDQAVLSVVLDGEFPNDPDDPTGSGHYLGSQTPLPASMLSFTPAGGIGGAGHHQRRRRHQRQGQRRRRALRRHLLLRRPV